MLWIKVVGSVAEIFHEAERAAFEMKKNDSSRGIVGQDEGFTLKVFYRLVVVDIDFGKNAGAQSRRHRQRMGGDKILSFCHSQFNSVKHDFREFTHGFECADMGCRKSVDRAVGFGDESEVAFDKRFQMLVFSNFWSLGFIGERALVVVGFSQKSHEKAFALHTTRDKPQAAVGSVNAVVDPTSARDIDFDAFKAEFTAEKSHVFFVFLAVESAGGIDEVSARSNRFGKIAHDFSLCRGA